MNKYNLPTLVLMFMTCIASDAEQQDAKYAEAVQLYKNGEFQKVIDKVAHLSVDQRQDDPRFIVVSGWAQLQLENYKQASLELSKALELGDSSGLPALAVAKLKLKDYEWLSANSGIMKAHMEKDSKMITIFAKWALETENMEILEDGLSVISDKEIAADESTSLNVLKVQRAFFLRNLLALRVQRELLNQRDRAR